MKKFLILLSWLAALGAVQAQTPKFTAEAQRAVIAGEKFQLVYSIDTEANDIRLPQLDSNFQILMGPSTSESTSVSISNGKMERTSQYSFTYILKANQPGKYTINPASITVNGKKVESNPLQIEVIKGDDAAARQSTAGDDDGAGISGDDLFITVTTNKRDAYKDEPILVTTKIYARSSVNLQGLSDVKNPELRDFISQELPRKDNIDWTIENYNGKTYNVGIYEQKLLFPQRAGSLQIEPTEIEFLVKQRMARRSTSIFDDFFESNFRTVKKRVVSKPLGINVKALPSPPPADFVGVVGNMDMKTSVSAQNVKTNDAVTIRIDVTGTGNHKLMDTPKLNVPADFDLFDPKITNNITNGANGMTGTKTFEYLIIPRHSGSYAIPAVTVSYFDLAGKQYKRLTTGDIQISVQKGSGEETSSSSQQYATSREDLKFIGKDIRYIKTDQGDNLKARGSFLFGSGLFYLFIIVPLLLFAAVVVYEHKQAHENSNVMATRNKKATKVALKRLRKAADLLKKNDKEAFYDEVLRALWGYMSDKLSLPVAKLSRENATTLMAARQAEPDTINRFMHVLDTCEFARYAPASGSSEMDKLYRETIETITLIEGQIKK
ncbi:MAG: BatD family protein [Breznakibacter sp.]